MHDQLLDLRFRDLLLFMLVYERRKLSDAALEMGFSTQTAERKLNSLREVFGDKLFTRSGSSGTFMVPTDRADMLFPKICEVFDNALALRPAERFDPADIDKTFRLAVNGHGLFFISPAFFSTFSEKCPQAKISIVRPSNDIYDMLRLGEADFGIVHKVSAARTGFFSHPLYTGKTVLIVRKGHPLEAVAKTRKLTPEDIARYPQVRLTAKAESYKSARNLDETLSETPVEQTPRFSTPFFYTGPLILAGNDCTCICPEIVARVWEQAGLVVCLETAFPLKTFSLSLIWHGRTNTLPEYQYVRSMLLFRPEAKSDVLI